MKKVKFLKNLSGFSVHGWQTARFRLFVTKLIFACKNQFFGWLRQKPQEAVYHPFPLTPLRFLIAVILYFSDNLPDFLGNSLNIFARVNANNFHAAFTG